MSLISEGTITVPLSFRYNTARLFMIEHFNNDKENASRQSIAWMNEYCITDIFTGTFSLYSHTP